MNWSVRVDHEEIYDFDKMKGRKFHHDPSHSQVGVWNFQARPFIIDQPPIGRLIQVVEERIDYPTNRLATLAYCCLMQATWPNHIKVFEDMLDYPVIRQAADLKRCEFLYTYAGILQHCWDTVCETPMFTLSSIPMIGQKENVWFQMPFNGRTWILTNTAGNITSNFKPHADTFSRWLLDRVRREWPDNFMDFDRDNLDLLFAVNDYLQEEGLPHEHVSFYLAYRGF
jgi:hypothetical protein